MNFMPRHYTDYSILSLHEIPAGISDRVLEIAIKQYKMQGGTNPDSRQQEQRPQHTLLQLVQQMTQGCDL